MPPYVVSACLAGIACRYNATSYECEAVQNLVSQGQALVLCPEVLGNLPIPREPVEILDGNVVNKSGQDFSSALLYGAQKALELCLKYGCKTAILKTRSPSCGRDFVYDGTFSGKLVSGQGFFAKLLQEHNITIYTEEDLPPIPNNHGDAI